MQRVPLILVAEQNDSDFRRLNDAFEALEPKCRVERVRDRDEAIAYLMGEERFCDRDRFPLPDLLMLELQLRANTGLEVLTWLRSESSIGPLPTLVLLTSDTQPAQIRAAYELGAASVLYLPDSDPAYRALIAALVEYWFVWNVPPEAPLAKPSPRVALSKQLLQTAVLTISDPRGNWDYGWKLICEAADLDPRTVMPPFKNRSEDDLRRATWNSLPNLNAGNSSGTPAS